MDIQRFTGLIISPEISKIPVIRRGYTDALGRKVTRKLYACTDGLCERFTIKSKNGSKVVAEGKVGDVPFTTIYYDKNGKKSREIVHGCFEDIYTPDGLKIFISRENLKRTGRDIRVESLKNPIRYEITATTLPNGEETFVTITKYLKRKVTDMWAYLKYDFFGKTQYKPLSDDETISYLLQQQSWAKERLAASKDIKNAVTSQVVNPYPLEELRKVLKSMREQMQ